MDGKKISTFLRKLFSLLEVLTFLPRIKNTGIRSAGIAKEKLLLSRIK